MDRIGRLLDEALAQGLGSAASVSVGDAGAEVFRHVAGNVRRLPDRGPAIDERSMFDLASVTKPMATIAIAMVLVGEGRLDLDAPVRAFLAGAQTTATVRELMGHTAGCAAHVEFFRYLATVRPADPRATLVERAMAEPCSEPGLAPVYSDLGFIQLGAVLEHAAGMRLEDAFAELVGGPLGLGARYARDAAIEGAVATELDERGLVCGRVHDENCYYGGGVAGHAGLFSTIGDVATFAAAMVETAAGNARGRFRPEVVTRFFTDAPTPGTTWRLGWDAPSSIPGVGAGPPPSILGPGVSQAGDRWPRSGGVGHTGYTGTSLWLDLPNRRWVALLTNRVHPTRYANTADAIKALRRAVGDAVVDVLG